MKAVFVRSYLHSFASDLILLTVIWPTEEKKLLNSFATVLSSLVNDLLLVDFLGMHDRIAFQIQRVLFGFLFICSAINSRSASLSSLLTSRLKVL